MNKLEKTSYILCLRFHKNLKLSEIAIKQGISRQAICQYINNNIRKLRNQEVILPKKCPFCSSLSILPKMLDKSPVSPWKKYSVAEEMLIKRANIPEEYQKLAEVLNRTKEAVYMKKRRLFIKAGSPTNEKRH